MNVETDRLLSADAKFTRFIEYAHKKKIRTKQVKINTLYYSYLSTHIFFQLFS